MLQDLLTFYEEYKTKIAAFGFVFGSLEFDLSTKAPKDGAAFTAEMLSVFQSDYFSYATAPEHIQKIEELQAATDDEMLKKEIALRLRDLHKISKLPKEVYVDYEKTISEAQRVWEDAKAADDYAMFKPHLISLIEKKKHILTYYDIEGSDYNHLVAEYQDGMTVELYDAFFAEVKEKLVPLIHRIKNEGRAIDTSVLMKDFDIETQIEFTEDLKEALQMNPRKTYLTESVHPFCCFFSNNDVRFTTKYIADNVMSSILSVTHEYGHALYGLQVDATFVKTELADGIGYAMHESQSRLLENYVGRNRGFWSRLYPKFQAKFPEQLAHTDLDTFLDMVNVSIPGFIRVEADELTYPLHVLIRYEIEKMIFNGEADYDTLDELWADKYEEYLGIRPATKEEGILQDVHWSCGYFGYFPSYALGSAFASQFYSKLKKDMDVDQVLADGQFDKIAEWLKENIHRYGASKSFNEILMDVTGEEFNPSYYTDYLVEKYTKLYHLS